MNVICNAAANGVGCKGAWLIVTGEPCILCAKLIHHAGIERVLIVEGGYLGANGVDYLKGHGVEVVAVPLFEHLDGTDPNDYVQRVEPSSQGGKKMAAAIVDAVLAERPEGGWPAERMPNAYRGDGSGAGGCAIL